MWVISSTPDQAVGDGPEAGDERRTVAEESVAEHLDHTRSLPRPCLIPTDQFLYNTNFVQVSPFSTSHLYCSQDKFKVPTIENGNSGLGSRYLEFLENFEAHKNGFESKCLYYNKGRVTVSLSNGNGNRNMDRNSIEYSAEQGPTDQPTAHIRKSLPGNERENIK